MDSIYDKIPFFAFLSDHDQAATMLKAALNRIYKDKKTKLAAFNISVEYVKEVLPLLQRHFSGFNLDDFPKLVENFETVATVCYLDKSERQYVLFHFFLFLFLIF